MFKFIIYDFHDTTKEIRYKRWIVFANSFERAKLLIGGKRQLTLWSKKQVFGTNKEGIIKYYENKGYKNNR